MANSAQHVAMIGDHALPVECCDAAHHVGLSLYVIDSIGVKHSFQKSGNGGWDGQAPGRASSYKAEKIWLRAYPALPLCFQPVGRRLRQHVMAASPRRANRFDKVTRLDYTSGMDTQTTYQPTTFEKMAQALTPLSIQEKFEIFHACNPAVYRELVLLAAQMRDLGYKRYSIDNLFGVLRWHRDLATTSGRAGSFKLNNDFRSRYARLIANNEPGFANFFYTRSLQTR